MATIGDVTHWRFAGVEFYRAGFVWEITVRGWSIYGIGWRVGLGRVE